MSDMFYDNNWNAGLHILTTFSCKHIRLAPYSVMNAKLAVAVFPTVSKAFFQYGLLEDANAS